MTSLVRANIRHILVLCIIMLTCASYGQKIHRDGMLYSGPLTELCTSPPKKNDIVLANENEFNFAFYAVDQKKKREERHTISLNFYFPLSKLFIDKWTVLREKSFVTIEFVDGSLLQISSNNYIDKPYMLQSLTLTDSELFELRSKEIKSFTGYDLVKFDCMKKLNLVKEHLEKLIKATKERWK